MARRQGHGQLDSAIRLVHEGDGAGIEQTLGGRVMPMAACKSGEPEAAQTDRFFGPRSAPVFLVFRPLRPGLQAGTRDATCADRGAVAFGAFSLPDIIADAFAGLQDQAVEVRVQAAAAAVPGLLYESGGQPVAPTAPGQAHTGRPRSASPAYRWSSTSPPPWH